MNSPLSGVRGRACPPARADPAACCVRRRGRWLSAAVSPGLAMGPLLTLPSMCESRIFVRFSLAHRDPPCGRPPDHPRAGQQGAQRSPSDRAEVPRVARSLRGSGQGITLAVVITSAGRGERRCGTSVGMNTFPLPAGQDPMRRRTIVGLEPLAGQCRATPEADVNVSFACHCELTLSPGPSLCPKPWVSSPAPIPTRPIMRPWPVTLSSVFDTPSF